MGQFKSKASYDPEKQDDNPVTHAISLEPNTRTSADQSSLLSNEQNEKKEQHRSRLAEWKAKHHLFKPKPQKHDHHQKMKTRFPKMRGYETC